MTNTGHCLCGAVTVTGEGETDGVSICHCAQCRKQGGGPYMAIRFLQGVSIAGETLRWFESSLHAERGFCNQCGSTVAWRMRGAATASVNVHLFGETNGLKVREEIFVDTPPDWYFAPHGAPRQTRTEALDDLETYLAARRGDAT